ncbi:hypothetical protein ACKAV7_008280 [Fusarium commune]
MLKRRSVMDCEVLMRINNGLSPTNAFIQLQQTIRSKYGERSGSPDNPNCGIVPDGDIFLVVGPEKTKLHVKSMLLMAVSKPLSVMLGPDWKEGHDMRHHNGPFVVSLPDDNATALEIICSVIHFQNDKIPRTLAAGDVLAVAVAADKYDCLNALQFASKALLRD